MTVYVGYARVSSVGQSLEEQLEKLKHCSKVFQDKKSGTTVNRSALKECMNYVREGDTLVITRLDRLARSTVDLYNIIAELEKKKVALQVIDQNINTNDATGRPLFNILGAIAQSETETRIERQIEGIKKALQNGVRFGRKQLLQPEEVLELKKKREEGTTIGALVRQYRLGKTSIYRYLNR